MNAGRLADWLLARLSEPSSWRGLIALATAGGITIAPEEQNAIIAAGMAVIGLINILRREKPGDTIVTTAPVTITAPATITTEPNPKG
ncbi:MAG: hypothetical protein U0835_00055 [Isosphaeraceae bacterium]